MHEHHGSTQTSEVIAMWRWPELLKVLWWCCPKPRKAWASRTETREAGSSQETPVRATPCYTLIWRFFFVSRTVGEYFFLEFFFQVVYLSTLDLQFCVSFFCTAKGISHTCIYYSSNLFPFRLFSSVQFSRSVVSDSLRPHESHHARPPCPSQTPGVHSNSCPLSQWCHPAISSSVVPFSSCP